MKKLSLFKKMLIGAGALLVASLAIVPAFSASQPRDFNGNAIMYGGAYSITELTNKAEKGTGQPHQGPGELNSFYTKLGMSPNYFDEMTNGTVYKDGRVVVAGKVVASKVYSAGRHDIDSSTRDNSFSYPIYWRHPSVSFVSDSIPAFVYMNYDGTMAFAVLKACGNPIKGVGVKTKPVPKYSLTVRKFEDVNGNKKKDTGESFLPGWTFRITGNNVDKTVVTGKDGSITVTGLLAGKYKVTESMQSGWSSTTGIEGTVTISNKNVEICFGNRKIPVKPNDTFSIKARKYEDINGNAKHDDNEPWLANWDIKLSGNNMDREFMTSDDGTVIFTNLPAGTYTVSEEMQTGWHNVTPISQKVTIPDPKTLEGYVEFGNQKNSTPVTPQGVVEQAPLPTAGPIDAVGGIFGGLSLASAGIYYRKGKVNLKNAFKKF